MLLQLEIPVSATVEKGPDGTWRAASKSLPGRHCTGEDREEATERLKQELECWAELHLARALCWPSILEAQELESASLW